MLAPTNQLELYQHIFDRLTPWSGFVPKGQLVDFLGIFTDANFRSEFFGADPSMVGGQHTTTTIPALNEGNGEWWFEVVNSFESAREARGKYVMMTLGAAFGTLAVQAHRALQLINPMPCKLVALDPVPANCQWIRKHFQDNDIDPETHWIIQMAIGADNEPVLFPIGAPGSGANNSIATNDPQERRAFAERLIAENKAPDAVRSLFASNKTGIVVDLLPGQQAMAELQYVSAVTLKDVLSPFDLVDYLEADIQQSEIVVFPPFISLLKKKVRRIQVGTHGIDAHRQMLDLFSSNGWHIVFSYEPNSTCQSGLGTFTMNDGVLTVRNPDL